MRRIISTASIVLLAMQLFLSTAYAVGPSTTESRIDYEDGSYAIITTVTPGAVRAAVADEKTYTYYNPSGKNALHIPYMPPLATMAERAELSHVIMI